MIKYSFQILSNLIQQLIYFIHILYKYNRKTKIDIKKGELIIIANGPSVKTKMPEIKKRSENTSVMGMNFIALSPDFYELKPSYYCLADPMFFVDTHRKTEAINLLHALDNNVTWKLKIYVPYNFSNKVNSFFKFTNENISIVVVNNCRYGGFNYARNYFYKIGLSCPEIYSVIIMAIYAGIKSKFSSIYLYGVDHTFFDKLQVNSSNELSSVYKHFDTNEFRLKKIIRIDNGEKWKISDYIIEKGLLFKSHDYLRSFANHMNVSIINCTKSSLIDSYVRESS